jgi:hypothetical protein
MICQSLARNRCNRRLKTVRSEPGRSKAPACGAAPLQLWCSAPAATPSARLSCYAWPSTPASDRVSRRAARREGPESWHGLGCRPGTRVSPGAAAMPCRRGARARHASIPGQFRPGPRHVLHARRPPDRACDRCPLSCRPQGRADKAAARRAWGFARRIRRNRRRATPWRRARPAPPNPPRAAFAGGPPRKGGSRRMVYQPRRRRFAGPVTLRRWPRRGAESPLP